MRYIGIDYGTKRIGIAVGDDVTFMAFPKQVVLHNKEFFSAILAIIELEKADLVVLGESKDFKGEDNLVMQEIRDFKEQLEKVGKVVVFESEFLTSHQASKSGVAKEFLDASSATIILQSYLDKLKNGYGK